MGPRVAAERRKRPLSGRSESGKRSAAASRPARLCCLSHWPAGCHKSVRRVGEGRECSVRHRLVGTAPPRAAACGLYRRRPSRSGRYAQDTTGECRGVRAFPLATTLPRAVGLLVGTDARHRGGHNHSEVDGYDA
ncbi:hypothetical protein MTO96_026045 [Rhipicephalus appendiculatus]